ncbi:topoisomerase DNA-binding C4 zinc finger domain-containing protein [Paenibacillus amylolyticus]|nr:topoisomerase DNA-binding C4 zinc finger domain-containing protein [Paenibacillus amylolyticus]
MKCSCGAVMVKRKNKAGVEFWGCSSYPTCRKTKAI